MCCSCSASPQSPINPVTALGRPVIVVNDLYGGGIGFQCMDPKSRWCPPPVSTTSLKPSAPLNTSSVSATRPSSMLSNRTPAEAAAIEQAFGTKVHLISSDELNTAYDKADRSESAKSASLWLRTAEKRIEPSEDEVRRSGQMYVAMRNLMEERNAQGIAVDCLTLFYGGKMPAYPCLGFFQMNDDGAVGACEGDLQSSITMLAIGYATVVPATSPTLLSTPRRTRSSMRTVWRRRVSSGRRAAPTRFPPPQPFRRP